MRASSQPPPRAWPETAAMIGFLIVVIWDQGSMKDVFRAWEKVRVDISFISAPAAKALAEPAMIMAEMDEELENSSRAVFNSLKRGVERALRAFGRLSVIWPTPGAGSEVRIYS